MEILEDIVSLNGKHHVRVLLPDGNTMFLKYPESPTQEMVDADVTRILRNQEFENIINSDIWTDPIYQTKGEFAAAFRERLQSSRGEENWRLAYWLIERINDGTFTDAQLRNAYGLTPAEYAIYKPKLVAKHDRYVELYSTQGD